MSDELWLAGLQKGDAVLIYTGYHYIPSVITRAGKITLYVRKLKFRRKDGAMIRERGSVMSVRGAALYRLVRTESAKGAL